MDWEKELKILINRVSNRNRVKSVDVEEVIETFFTSMKNVIQDDDMPSIIVPNLGKFVPNRKYLEEKVKAWKRKDPVGRSEDIKRLERIIQRLKDEKHVRTKP